MLQETKPFEMHSEKGLNFDAEKHKKQGQLKLSRGGQITFAQLKYLGHKVSLPPDSSTIHIF